MITLKNKKIHDFIVQKDELVNQGRKISATIEDINRKIEEYEVQEKKITGSIQPNKELKDEGDKLAKDIEKTMNRLEEIGQKIEQEKLDAIPKEIKEAHQGLMKEREVLERQQAKLALKVQKIKDKIIPVIRKEVKPLLNQYDDIDTAKVKDGEVVINTFNHLEDWKRHFNSR